MREVFYRSAVYAGSSALSGSVIGFLLTTIVYLITFWMPQVMKISLLLVIVIPFIFHEWRWFKIKIPQNTWQIPPSWVSGPPARNMMVWGLILGAGIFTYIPHIIFYLQYIYIAFFKSPLYGAMFGALYGIGRALPALVMGFLRNLKGIVVELSHLPKIHQISRLINSVVLVLLAWHLINILL